MAAVAKRLAKLECHLDAIITSPLLRAKQTAEIVAGVLGLRECLTEDTRLGGEFGPDRLREILREHSDADALMLVGHEPSMSETVGRAVGGARIDFKKGAIACVEIVDLGSLRGELLWMAPPKLLAG